MRGNVSKSTVSIDGPEAEIVFREGNVYARNGAGESKLISNAPSYAYISIRGGADSWIGEEVVNGDGAVIGHRYGQKAEISGATITPRSRVDLFADSDQMAIFREKDLAFVAENNGGIVTVYCVGSVPQNDYTIKATVSEVSV